MEIYKSPEYLVLHLKRFQTSKYSFGSSRKIEDLIEFPVESLDLSNYILSNQNSEVSYLYDLYAVSNHMGTMNGGHYTAYAKNPITGSWFEFDDTHVTKIDPEKVVSHHAYVLFYKRRI